MTYKQGEHSSLIELYDKYELSKPVPIKVQRFYSSRIRKIFKRVAIATGIYTLSFSLATFFYFLLKKLGLVFSTKFLVSFAIVASIATGSTVTYIYINTQEDVEDVIITVTKSKKDKKAVIPQSLHKVAIRPFRSRTIDKELLTKTVNTLRNELSSSKGSNFSKIIWGYDKSIRYLLSGSIEKVENSNILFIQLIDKNRSTVLYTTREAFTNDNELTSACKKISSKVISLVK